MRMFIGIPVDCDGDNAVRSYVQLSVQPTQRPRPGSGESVRPGPRAMTARTVASEPSRTPRPYLVIGQ